ncbi:hypothetical protein C6503_19035 [Candidatus Poribacteria bacterium]|nr:MAG: hypothetical protein C6503_19035 [Candidatus Poribacteria bacterium]
MTVHLLSAAMIPTADGTYRSSKITRELFSSYASVAKLAGDLKTYVECPETAEILSTLCGFEIEANSDKMIIEDGDILLIAKPKYRLVDLRQKRKATSIADDFEFHSVVYIE